MKSRRTTWGWTMAGSLVAGSLLAASIAGAQTFPEERVASIRVEPSEIALRVGERVPVEITPLDADGDPLDDIFMQVFEARSNAGYDDATGEVFGVVPGDGLITARVRRSNTDGPGFNDVFGYIQITVSPGAPDRIDVDAPAMLYTGNHASLSATAWSGDTKLEDASIRWRSDDPDIVSVSAGGLATAHAVGEARLSAHAEDAQGAVTLRVAENPVRALEVDPLFSTARVGDVVRLSATTVDANGRGIEAPVSWSLLSGGDADGAYIDSEGAFVAYEEGLHRVAASAGAYTAIAEIEAATRTPRHQVNLLAHGVVPTGQATTDLWVFEGQDGRDYSYTGTYSGNLMYAWDVTDPSQPVITDSIAFDGRRVNDVKINADASIAVVTSENAANRRNGITLLDLTDPAHPTRITHYTDGLTGGVHNTWIEGDLVYAVHDGTNDVHIVDISDPENPATVGRWGVDAPNRNLHDVNIEDGLAYLSYWDEGVVVLDVGNGVAGGTPAEPVLVSQYKYKYRLGPDTETYGNTHHAVRYGDYVFAGDEIFGCAECINGPRGYIHVLDVSDIRNPREVAHYRVPEAGAHNMWAEDDKLYIGYYQAGLRVLDISGELRGDLYRQGREIAVYMTEDAQGSVPNATDTWGAQPHKGSVFASDPNSGLWIVELVPPAGATVF